MKTIKLYQTQTGWLAQSETFRAVMGTDVLPTAFTAKADAGVVLSAIKKLNPDCEVEIAHERFQFRS